MKKYDVAIIGGGASGLACAVSIKAECPALSVAVIEAGERAGKKLASTGNGQGNLSNADMSGEHYHGGLGALAARLCCSGEYDPLKFLGLIYATDRAGRIYPAGKQASSLSDRLIRLAEKSGVEIMLSTRVEKLDKGFTLYLSSGEKLSAGKVVLAAGGAAQKQFLTDGNAFTLAKGMGHTVTPLYPSLVQLKCDTRHIKTLKGIRAECKVRAFSKSGEFLKETYGDVIFTDYGVSGNAIFYISAYCSHLTGVKLSLEFLPEVKVSELVDAIKSRKAEGYPDDQLLSGALHNQIGRAIIRRAACSDPEKIAELAKNFTLEVTSPLGFDYAQVTKGGICADEVDENLQSKKVQNLYFTGEVLDVDGDCGGYNLHWAFVSGMHVAKHIAEAAQSDD